MDAIYARQSVDKKDSISIESQINFCIPESKSPDGYMIFKDKGFSGKNTNRPDFLQMMREVKKGKIKRIIVYKIDRFSRSLLDFAFHWEILQKYNVDFISINEKFDTSTPMGRAMLFILMIFAQLERETISERCVDNYYERIKRKVWPGGPAPFGFENDTCYYDGMKCPTLVTNKDIDIMIDNFIQYAKEDMSLGKLAKLRIGQQLETVQKIVWNNVSLSRLLKNPVYVKADIFVYMYFKEKGYKFSNPIEEWNGEHAAFVVGKKQYISSNSKRDWTKSPNQTVSLLNIPGVVDSKVWLECNRKLDKNSQIKNSGAGKHTWLTGLIKCGKCGYALKVMVYQGVKETKKYLVCSGHTNGHICPVSKFNINIEEVEQIIEDEIEKIIAVSAAEEVEEIEITNQEENKLELAKIEEQIDRLIKSISDASAVTMKYINSEIEKLDKKKNAINKMLTKKGKAKKIEPISFKKLMFDEKKKVVQNYIEKIYVYDDKIDIKWKI